MTTNTKATIASVIAAVAIIGVAVFVRASSGNSSGTNTSTSTKKVTKVELSRANGQNGSLCWVAVDGTVYQIQQGFQWQEGKHVPSDGQAYCGADLSKVIDKAPHGRSKLATLQKIGMLN